MAVIDNTNRTIQQSGIPSSAALGAMREAILGLRVNSLKLALYPSPEMREDSNRRLALQLKKFSEAQAAYSASIDHPDERALFETIKPILQATEPGIRQLIDLGKQGREKEMIDLLNGSLRQNSEQSFPKLYVLTALNDRNMKGLPTVTPILRSAWAQREHKHTQAKQHTRHEQIPNILLSRRTDWYGCKKIRIIFQPKRNMELIFTMYGSYFFWYPLACNLADTSG
ncbi:MCP four helix bundle domain-containing protein [Pseudomonas abietaniphila]|uniref:MCP four helix bundle domain-containing protein n=1 Tax=Pseudomonas abietaniphila TaxID=89065 RepID=UPI003D35A4DD